MQRVLRPGGFGLIMDLNGETPAQEIDDYVDQMPMGTVSRSMTRFIFKHMLIKRAYVPADSSRMAAASRFKDCKISPAGIGIDIWLRKPSITQPVSPPASALPFSPLLFV